MFTSITNHHAASMRALTCFILIQSDAPNSSVIGLVVNAVAIFSQTLSSAERLLLQSGTDITQTPLTTSVAYAAALMRNSSCRRQKSEHRNHMLTQPEPTGDEGTCHHGHKAIGLTRPANLQMSIGVVCSMPYNLYMK